MNGFFRELRANIGAPITLVAWGFVALLLALAGPFGSYGDVPLLKRLVFWSNLIALCIVLTALVAVAMRRLLGSGSFWLGSFLTASLVTSGLTGPLCRVADIFGEAFRVLPPTPAEIATFVFSMAFGLCALWQAHEAQLKRRVAAGMTGPGQPVGSQPAGPRLLERLPDQLRGTVHRVSGRDHYVEVATERGVYNILLRFSDALTELEGCDGLQVHRSHWVASCSVICLVREGNRLFLRLSCGVLVPVSRTYLPAVEARGWSVQA